MKRVQSTMEAATCWALPCAGDLVGAVFACVFFQSLRKPGSLVKDEVAVH